MNRERRTDKNESSKEIPQIQKFVIPTREPLSQRPSFEGSKNAYIPRYIYTIHNQDVCGQILLSGYTQGRKSDQYIELDEVAQNIIFHYFIHDLYIGYIGIGTANICYTNMLLYKKGKLNNTLLNLGLCESTASRNFVIKERKT